MHVFSMAAAKSLSVAYKKGRSTSRPDEIFTRTKVDAFVSLVLQTDRAGIEKSLLLKAAEDHQHLEGADEECLLFQKHLTDNGCTTDRASLQSVICGLGESDFEQIRVGLSNQQKLKTSKNHGRIDDSRPYLLLDVRNEDEYNMGHIITAVNYPSYLLARATNFETVEMLAYKNFPGKMIFVYDNKEKIAPNVASTLVQRNYDNVSMLSGGLLAAYQKYPKGLITGSIPAELKGTVGTDKNKFKLKKRKMPVRSSSLPPNGAAFKSYNLKSEFSDQDLELLRQQLQYNLLPKLSRSRLVKDTSAARIRNEDIRKQQKHIIRNKPWV